MIGAIVAITFLMLVAILRAPLLAALTVALNLVSVGAAIGVVWLRLQASRRLPVGRPPYIDTVGAAAIFGVTFGLSIDYAVFLLGAYAGATTTLLLPISLLDPADRRRRHAKTQEESCDRLRLEEEDGA